MELRAAGGQTRTVDPTSDDGAKERRHDPVRERLPPALRSPRRVPKSAPRSSTGKRQAPAPVGPPTLPGRLGGVRGSPPVCVSAAQRQARTSRGRHERPWTTASGHHRGTTRWPPDRYRGDNPSPPVTFAGFRGVHGDPFCAGRRLYRPPRFVHVRRGPHRVAVPVAASLPTLEPVVSAGTAGRRSGGSVTAPLSTS